MARIGQIIDGKFRILKPVGRGGMSRVYLAQDIHLEKRWVVKEIPKFINGGKNSLFINAALSEAEIIKGLDHPSIVRIVDIAQDARAVYIVEDYVAGRSLKEIADSEEGIRPADLKNWAEQLARVLIYLHSRTPAVIYRDLKPENIILTETGHLKLVDFGIARRYRPEGDRDTVYLGTVQFAAPEQYEEYGAQTDMRTDIYGYGKTLEYLACYCPGLSESVYALIDKCTREDPKDRYQSGEELLRALTGIRDFSREMTRRKMAIRVLLALCAGGVLLLAAVRRSPGNDVDLMSEVRGQLGTIREDMVFSLQEEESLLTMIMPHLSELKETEGFEETAFDIGELYRKCYQYGSGAYAGAEEAIFWYELAGDDNMTARICVMLGRYLASARETDPGSAENGAYQALMEQLLTLAARTASGEVPADLQSEVCRIAADALIANAYQYRKDGVSLRDAQLLLTHISHMIIAVKEADERNDLSTGSLSADGTAILQEGILADGSVPVRSTLAAEQLQQKLDLATQAVSDAWP